jgi:hypothetical protein
MKINIVVEIEADRIACLNGEWYCGDKCRFNDSSMYCQLYWKDMKKRLPECIAAQKGKEKV